MKVNLKLRVKLDFKISWKLYLKPAKAYPAYLDWGYALSASCALWGKHSETGSNIYISNSICMNQLPLNHLNRTSKENYVR